MYIFTRAPTGKLLKHSRTYLGDLREANKMHNQFPAVNKHYSRMHLNSQFILHNDATYRVIFPNTPTEPFSCSRHYRMLTPSVSQSHNEKWPGKRDAILHVLRVLGRGRVG